MIYPDTLAGKHHLFEGKYQYSRYTNILPQIITKHMPDLKTLGVEEGDMGTNSSRKGVANMVESGCTVHPPFFPIFLCAGWVMGSVKDRYLKHASAEDQYIGC